MKSNKVLGAQKITVILMRDYGINISQGRVYRLMKSIVLPQFAAKKPKWKARKTNSESKLINHLKQKFNPERPNQIWTTDFTYISIAPKKFVYLSVILDLYARKVIAWKVSPHIDTKLALDTLETAIQKRKATPELFHSDRGVQYTAKKFRQELDKHNILASYSQPGYPYDNSVTEVFFKYFKLHCANRSAFSSIEEVRLACFRYIEQFYNDYRPHQTNNQLTPNQKEARFP